jgi:hypothetical protein
MWGTKMARKLSRLPAPGTKDRAKLEAMLRQGPSRGARKYQLQEIDGNGGWGTYKNDGKRYADFLGGKLHVTGIGATECYWIELPQTVSTKPSHSS